MPAMNGRKKYLWEYLTEALFALFGPHPRFEVHYCATPSFVVFFFFFCFLGSYLIYERGQRILTI